jgi:hypothetical protein
VHNRRLRDQELEEVVVNFESGLKARFLPWLQPGSPEEADRRDDVARERLPWGTQQTSKQGPLDCAVFCLVESPPRTPRQPIVGHIKKKCPRAVFSRLSASSGVKRAWLQPRQKARLQNRFQSNNNLFKLLLQQPPLLQLRLTILTKQG